MTVYYGDDKLEFEQTVGFWKENYEEGWLKVVDRNDEVSDKLFSYGDVMTDYTEE